MNKKDIEKTFSIEMIDNIIICTYFQDLSSKDNIERSHMIKENFERLLGEAKGGEIFAVADLTKLSSKDKLPHESRLILAGILKDPRIQKFAGVGGTIYLRTIGSFVARMTGRSKLFYWAKTLEEAKKWLKK